jgi:hypothetical protein
LRFQLGFSAPAKSIHVSAISDVHLHPRTKWGMIDNDNTKLFTLLFPPPVQCSCASVYLASSFLWLNHSHYQDMSGCGWLQLVSTGLMYSLLLLQMTFSSGRSPFSPTKYTHCQKRMPWYQFVVLAFSCELLFSVCTVCTVVISNSRREALPSSCA